MFSSYFALETKLRSLKAFSFKEGGCSDKNHLLICPFSHFGGAAVLYVLNNLLRLRRLPTSREKLPLLKILTQPCFLKSVQ